MKTKKIVLKPKDFEDIKQVVRGKRFVNGKWIKDTRTAGDILNK